MNSIIQLKHLYKRFGPLVVLKDVSLDIEVGKTLVVLGPSGTGKSVLLKHIDRPAQARPGRSLF